MQHRHRRRRPTGIAGIQIQHRQTNQAKRNPAINHHHLRRISLFFFCLTSKKICDFVSQTASQITITMHTLKSANMVKHWRKKGLAISVTGDDLSFESTIHAHTPINVPKFSRWDQHSAVKLTKYVNLRDNEHARMGNGCDYLQVAIVFM